MLHPTDIGKPPVMVEHPEWWLLPEAQRRKVYAEAEVERQNLVAALADERAGLLRRDGLYPGDPVRGLVTPAAKISPNFPP
ncbi:MAG: hypothetical protein JO250_04640 [Armatimonadetes bacterium]|nr:hypothetical protein [Armatimonadota bacterium]